MTKIISAVLLLSLWFSPAFASLPMFPPGCQISGFQFNYSQLLLQPTTQQKPEEEIDTEEDRRQTVYLLHNFTSSSIELSTATPAGKTLYHPYKNTLNSDQWGVFVTNKPAIDFTCREVFAYDNGEMPSPADSSESEANDEDGANYSQPSTNCTDVIEVCQYPRAKFSVTNKGNYWLENSNTKGAAVRRAIQSGILLRW